MTKLLIRVLVVFNVLIFLQVLWPLMVQRPREFPARHLMLDVVERHPSGPVAKLRDDHASQRSLAIFVNQVSTTCASGDLLRFADRLAGSSAIDKVVAVLPDSYSTQDAENLKRQLRLTFEVVIADEILSEQWTQLSRDYSLKAVNGLAFLFTESGTEVFQGKPQLKVGLGALSTDWTSNRSHLLRLNKRR